MTNTRYCNLAFTSLINLIRLITNQQINIYFVRVKALVSILILPKSIFCYCIPICFRTCNGQIDPMKDVNPKLRRLPKYLFSTKYPFTSGPLYLPGRVAPFIII